mgnify:FL=1
MTSSKTKATAHAVMNTGSDVLDRIMQHKAGEVASAKLLRNSAALLSDIQSLNTPTRGFADAVASKAARGESAVIAEVKKASPSKGVIRADFDPALIAKQYQAGGACCLAVLTDHEFFKGSTDFLKQARAATDLPIIRKDFMLDPYQVLEARAMGADAILLIVAALEDGLMRELADAAAEQNLDILVEVHNAHELERGLALTPKLLGINNRNLRNFETSLNNTLDLLSDIPEGTTVVTESGIHSKQDIELMRQHHVHAFLVGEAFMRASDPGAKLRELFFA